jgi:hypothetical protein
VAPTPNRRMGVGACHWPGTRCLWTKGLRGREQHERMEGAGTNGVVSTIHKGPALATLQGYQFWIQQLEGFTGFLSLGTPEIKSQRATPPTDEAVSKVVPTDSIIDDANTISGAR